MSGVTIRPFFFGGLAAKDLEELRLELTSLFTEIESTLSDLRSIAEYGPVPGAYFPIDLGRSNSPGTALSTGAVDQFAFDFELRPIYMGFVCYGGNLTVDLISQGSSILAAGPVALVATAFQAFNSRSDFAVDKVTGDITLSIVSIDSGTPIHIRSTVLGKSVSKVEPA